jgi:hypothetical protein
MSRASGHVHAFIVVCGITGGLVSRPGFAEDSGGEPRFRDGQRRREPRYASPMQ